MFKTDLLQAAHLDIALLDLEVMALLALYLWDRRLELQPTWERLNQRSGTNFAIGLLTCLFGQLVGRVNQLLVNPSAVVGILSVIMVTVGLICVLRAFSREIATSPTFWTIIIVFNAVLALALSLLI